MVSPDVKEEIKNRVDIVELIGEYVQLTARGDSYWGLSPFKTEKTPSFTVTPSKQMYYCFSTKKGGDIFSFLMEVESMTFKEALEYLGKKVGVDVSARQGQSSEQSYRREALEELYKKVEGLFHHFLTQREDGKNALQYIRGRGIEDPTIQDFKLGYAHPDPYWLYAFLISREYSPDLLARSGLFSKNYPKRCLFYNRLMFPIRRHQGNAIAFGGRILEGDGPKYINSPETDLFHKRKNLYGLEHAKKGVKDTGSFIICEGYLDVLAFFQAGMPSAVAPLGTAFTPEQGDLLKRFGRQATLVFDGDSAGASASQKTAIVLAQKEIATSVIPLESGNDPADILKKKGSQHLKNLVKSSIVVLDYLFSEAASVSDATTPEGKEQIFGQLFPYIQNIQSPIQQEASLKEVADRFGLSESAVINSFNQQLKRQPKRTADKKPAAANYGLSPEKQGSQDTDSKKPDVLRLSPTLQLMVVTAVYPEYFAYVRKNLKSHDIEQGDASMMYSLFEHLFRVDELNFDKILSEIDNEGLKSIIMKKVATNEFSDDPALFINKSILNVKQDLLIKKRREVEMKLKQVELDGDSKSTRELLEEKMYLDTALNELKDSINDRTAE